MKKTSVYVLAAALILSLLGGCSMLGVSKQAMAYVDTAEEKTLLLFVGGESDNSIGQLYLQTLGDEKEKVSDGVMRNEYKIYPKTSALLFLNSQNQLYIKYPNAEKEKLSDGVVKSSYSFSEDGSTVMFLHQIDAKQSSPLELYVEKLSDEKDKVSSEISRTSTTKPQISADGTIVFFVDRSGNFFKKESGEEKEKIASGVQYFSINETGDAFTYQSSGGNTYAKWQSDVEPQKITGDKVGNLKLSSNGLVAVYTGDYNATAAKGELYLIYKDSSPFKIASDILKFDLSKDGRHLYYINDEGILYEKEIPKIDAKTTGDSTKFKESLGKAKKVKLCADANSFKVDPTGTSALILDKEGNLYLSDHLKDKLKVAPDVTAVKLFTDSFIYVTKDRKLSLVAKFGGFEKGNSLYSSIGENVDYTATSEYGKYIAFFNTETNEVSLCVNGKEPEEFLHDATAFDQVSYNNIMLYEKKLKLSEIAGIYKSVKSERCYSLTANNKLVIYQDGVPKETSNVRIESSDKASITLVSPDKASELYQAKYTFTKKSNGALELSIGTAKYTLTKMTDAELKTELAAQKKAAANRAAEAKRLAALTAKKARAQADGKYYVRNGKYISNDENLYAGASFSSRVVGSFINSSVCDILDYKVTSSGDLWLKTWCTNDEDGFQYVWVFVSE